MSPKKPTKNIKKEQTINSFPSLLIKYNQHISQLPRDINSVDENLKSVFRIMWNTNLLLKHFMDSNEISEASCDNQNYVDMESALKVLHKTIWKLNSLLISEFHLDTRNQHKDI